MYLISKLSKKLNCVPHCIFKVAQKSILHCDLASARKVSITSDAKER